MSVSDVQICNLALTKIGEDQITALTDNSKPGRLCNLHYATTRDVVLRDHKWNFAIARVALGQTTETPLWDWEFAFNLPADCLRVLTTDLLEDDDWKVEGRQILSHDDTVNLQYIKQVVDTSQFDSLFIEALSARLAAELTIPLTDDKKLSQSMFNLYGAKLAAARSVDAMEGTPDNIIAETWLNARLGQVS